MPFRNVQFTQTCVPALHPPGTWCSGITSASHAEGPGFKSQCVHAQCQSIPPRNVCDRQRHAAILRLRPCPRALPLAQCLFGCRHQRWCGTGRARSECRKGNVNSQLQRESGDPVARSTMHHTALCMDTLGIEPRAFRMLSGCDTTTPRALKVNAVTLNALV